VTIGTLKLRSQSALGLGLLALTLVPGLAKAQNIADASNIGFPPNGVFDGSDFDNVQTVNGNLHVHLPLFQVKGRGPAFYVNLDYDGVSYYMTERCIPSGYCYGTWHINPGGGWKVSTPHSYAVKYTLANTGLCNNPGNGVTAATGVTLAEPDGTRHHFLPDQSQMPPFCFSPIPNGLMYADDGSGWALRVDPNTGIPVNGALGFDVLKKDGTEIWGNGTNFTLTDSNGNQITSTMNTSTWTFTDTLGRTITVPIGNTSSGVCAASPCEIDYKDSNGTPQKIQMSTTNVDYSTNFSCSGDVTCTQYHGAENMPSLITLPNGLQYTFSYANAAFQYGELTSATLPTGGQIGWAWQLSLFNNTQVTSRTVTANGNNFIWNYSYGVTSPRTTTVTDPALNDTRYTCSTFSFCQTTKVESFSGSASGGTLLKTVATDYDSTLTFLPIRDTSTWAQTNQVTKIETDYDSFNTGQMTVTWRNPTKKREYAFGTGSPGALVRTTQFDYLHQANSSYRIANIADRPADKIVYEANGTTIHAKTLYSYDNTTLSPTSGVVSHDYVHFPSTNTLRGNSTQVQNWRNTDNTFLSTYNYYNDVGDLIQIKDPKNNITSFDYTDSWYQNTCAPASGITQAFVTKKTNALTQSATAKYNSCSSLTGSTTDLNGETATYAYDAMGRRTQTSLIDGGQTTFSYGASLPITNVTTTKITLSPSVNRTTTTVLDDLGQVKQTQLNSDPDGVTCVDTTYDAFGRKVTVTNPYRSQTCSGSSVYTSYAFDALGRLNKVKQTDGSTINTAYADVCSTVTDEAGRIRKSCADAQGRLTQAFEPDGSNTLVNETDYQYDVADNLISVNQKGNDSNSGHWRTRTFGYNSLSQLTSSINPEIAPTGGLPCTITYTYDGDGNVATKTAPVPNQLSCSTTVTTNFSYDNVNRVTGKTFTNGDPSVSYAYDGNTLTGCSTGVSNYGLAIGKRTAMCDAAGVEAWIYADVQNQGWQITDHRVTNNVTKSAAYQDNLDGSQSTLTYPSSRVMTYTQGGAGRPLSVVDSVNNYATNAHYAPHGGLGALTDGSNLSMTYIYNNRLQPCWLYTTTETALPWNTTACTGAATPGTIIDLKYDFGLGADNGNVNAIANNRDGTRSQTFSYDTLNRISTAKTTSTTGAHCWGESFTVDIWANLSSITPLSGYTGCTTENLSLVLTPQNQVGGDTYDAAGNLTVVPGTGGASYTYNAQGQMTATAGITYLYDGDGKRVEKATTGPPLEPFKLYWYGMGDDPLDETDATGSITTSSFNEYVFFAGKRIGRRDSSSNVFYYFADNLGTSRVNVQAGQTTPCYDADFYPFGVERVITNTCPQDYKFTGKERDAESGLDYFGARYYASNIGRFSSADLKGLGLRHLLNPQKLNKYSYVLNNPLSLFDPNGMEEITITYRTFIPAQTFTYMRENYSGDGRGFSTAPNAPSRTSITVTLETDASKRPGNPIINITSSAGPTQRLDSNGNVTKEKTATVGLPTATGTRDANGNPVIEITQDTKNPLSPVFQFLTPGISADLSVTVPQDASNAQVTGTASVFPAQELNVTRADGNTTPILQFQPASGATATSLFNPDRTVDVQKPTPRCSTDDQGKKVCSQ